MKTSLIHGDAVPSPRCLANPRRGRRGSIMCLAVALVLNTASVFAAKGDQPDKVADPEKRIDKFERKLDRQGAAAELAAAVAQRQAMAASAPAPESDRSGRDRGDRGVRP